MRVEVTYGSGLKLLSDAVAIDIANVAPTAELNNDGPVDEGSAGVIVSFAAQSDLSAADRAASFRYSYDFDNDGVFEQTDTNQSSFLVPAEYLTDDGTVRVRAVIKDQDEGATELFTDIIVRCVAPQLLLSGADDAVEGAVYSLNLAADDPGNDTITQWIVDWGDGTTEVYGAGPQSVTHRFVDDGQWTIAVTAVDEDSIYTAVKDVGMSNAAPELSVLVDPLSPIAENDLATLTATIAEPGVLDSFVLEVQWGDGAEESFSLPAGTTTVTLVHRYADDGSYAIDLSLWDDDGGVGSASTSVEVANAAPAIGSLGLASRVVSEGGLVIVTGSISDAGSLDTHTVTVQWGDGSESDALVDPTTAHVSRDAHVRGRRSDGHVIGRLHDHGHGCRQQRRYGLTRRDPGDGKPAADRDGAADQRGGRGWMGDAHRTVRRRRYGGHSQRADRLGRRELVGGGGRSGRLQLRGDSSVCGWRWDRRAAGQLLHRGNRVG